MVLPGSEAKRKSLSFLTQTIYYFQVVGTPVVFRVVVDAT
jgi:hypothetical protein